MTGSGRRWRAGDLVAAALDLGPEELRAFLDRECGEDRGLRREVEALLAADARSGEFLTRPPLGPTFSDYPEVGDRLGAYELVSLLGEGGSSRVFLGRRVDDDFRHRVAVKVVRPGGGSDDMLRRFRRERQILARFDHPSIARLFDGGAADGGLPYFVMEFVEGMPIDLHCEEAGLGIEARLDLFLAVCSAVSYAHQRQVVHRDLKPSNILVTAEGEVKLLDFGIAKLLALEPALEPAETVTWQRLLTPRYASPEQLRGDLVTTATDTYSLGLVLFELLAGGPPFEVDDQPLAEIARRREGGLLPSPSQIVEVAGRAAPAEVSGRPSRPLARRRLAGDLDCIVSKALRPDPDQRYATVEQLQDDLRRHLAGQPVRARAGTLRYRGLSFVRRHRLAVAGGGLVVALGAGFVVSTLWQAAEVEAQRVVAERERDVAVQERQRATRFYELMMEIFAATDPADPANREVSARELLDRAVPRILERLEGDPQTAGAVLARVGDIYRDLGALEPAEEHLTAALELQNQLPPESTDALETLVFLGLLRQRQGRFDEAESYLRQAVNGAISSFGEDASQVATARLRLTELLYEARRLEGAEKLGRQALAVFEGSADHREELAAALTILGRIEALEGRLATAEQMHQRALELRRIVLGPRHNLVGESLSDLAQIRNQAGDIEAAAALMAESLEIFRQALGEKHPATVTLQTNVAMTLLKLGRTEQAETLARQALAARAEGIGHGLHRSHNQLVLASILLARELPGAAARHFETSLQECRAAAPEHPLCGFGRLGLARCARAEGRIEDARAIGAQILEQWGSVVPPGHRLLEETEELLATL